MPKLISPSVQRLLRGCAAVFITAAFLAGCNRPVEDQKTAVPKPAAATRESGSGESGFPLSITDDTGRRLEFSQAPQRIISLAPSETEILYAIGAGDRVVADTTADDYPPAAVRLPKVGDYRPSAEKIVSFKPDLVIAVRGNQPLLDALLRLHVPVFITDSKSVRDVEETVRALGKVTGCQRQAVGVAAGMERRIKAVEGLVKDSKTPSPTGLIEIWFSAGEMVAGPKTYMGDVFRLAGGKNIAPTSGSDFPTLSTESVLTLNPQCLILTGTGQSAASVAKRAGWSRLQAVRSGKIFAINGDLINRPAPRIVAAVEQIAHYLHPDAHG